MLVSTTIIESGLDIPNANTIVIDRADALGLAQLYQLRGRVGRSSRRAYAYLLYRRKAALSPTSHASAWQAIFNASELGAGFQIALSDLEIRGAGNILGASSTVTWRRSASTSTRACWPTRSRRRRRHSRVASRARPGRRPRSTCPSTPTCPTTTCPRSPRSWSCTGVWAGSVSDDGLEEIRAELLDRYGALPPPVERLLEVSRLRYRAEEAGLSQVSREDGQLVFRFGPDWSRADTMRALAPRSVDDPLRALQGRVRYASNQVRVRPPSRCGPCLAADPGDRRSAGRRRERWSSRPRLNPLPRRVSPAEPGRLASFELARHSRAHAAPRSNSSASA